MKKLFAIITIVTCIINAYGNNPDTLTLDACLEIASVRNPIARQKSISEMMLNYRLKNLKTNWYPNAGFNAQALYNSETVEFSDLLQNLPVSIPSLPLDQYKVWAEINQQIYDGGMIRIMKEIERAGYRSELYQTESELYSLRSQVSQVYFSLLLTQNNSGIISSSLNLLAVRKNNVKAGVANGVILAENLLALEAEEISLQQKHTELSLLKGQLLKVLSILTDSSLSSDLVMDLPDFPAEDESGLRPEIRLFEEQKVKLDNNIKLVESADLPKVYAFSQLAWGRPGYNFVSRDFHTFYTIGAGLKWNFLNYGDSKRQKRMLGLQQELVDIKRRNFDDQLSIQMQTEATNIEKYNTFIKQDELILGIRKTIAEASLSRLNNGTITSAEYLGDMNDELLARLLLESHKILKKQAEYNYLMLQGKLKY